MNLFNGAVFIPEGATGRRQGLSLQLLHKVNNKVFVILIHDNYFFQLKLQWNLSFGTPLFRGHIIWSSTNVHLIFAFITSIEGTPLFRGKGHFFRVPIPEFNLHSGDTLTLQKGLTTKIVVKF